MNDERLVLTDPTVHDEVPPGRTHPVLADRERRWLLVILDRLETPERVSALTRAVATYVQEGTGSVPEDVEAVSIDVSPADDGNEENETEAVGEREDPDDGRDDVSVDALHARLHHLHVPKLAAAGFVDYDRESRTVTLTDDGERLAAGLDVR